mgnify:CR=1 FL=1
MVVVLSQHPYSQKMIKDFFYFLENSAGASLLGGFRFGKDVKNDAIKEVDNNQLQGSLISTPFNTSINEAKDKKWTIFDIPQKIVENVKNGGEVIENGIDNIGDTKEKVFENISSAKKNIQNYFSGIGNSIVNPGTPHNCPPAETSSSSQPNP